MRGAALSMIRVLPLLVAGALTLAATAAGAGDLKADEVLVLLEGRLEILAPGERDDRPGVAQIEPGGFVGEVALVIGGPR